MDSPAGNETTYDLRLLEKSSKKWKQSSALRAVYGDIYNEVCTSMVEGESLEIGSGIGNAAEFIPDLVTSDVVKTPFVDKIVSAYRIPLPEAEVSAWGNIIAFDVFHHLRSPLDFFCSAFRALEPGGRLILVEPAATPWGRLFYGLFHPEPMKPSEVTEPFRFDEDTAGDFANMAMGFSFFESHRSLTESYLSQWEGHILSIRYRDFLAYPLTGGYGSPQFLPSPLIRLFLKLEKCLPRLFYRICGLRMVIVMEKGIPEKGSSVQ